jgi:hypothetical protein
MAVDITSYEMVDHADFLHSILAIYIAVEAEPIYVARPAFCAFYAEKADERGEGGASGEGEGGEGK